MLKKSVTYTDFNGIIQTEDLYFNLTKAELIEMDLGSAGGLGEHLSAIAKSGDGEMLVTEFKRILLLAYGEKSEDGRHFIKSDEVKGRFLSSAAYDELFFELATNMDSIVEFVEGILPQDMVQAAKAAKKQDKPVGLPKPGPRPPKPPRQ